MLRLLSILTTLFTYLILFHPNDGPIQMMVWGPKLMASALSPLLALVGTVFVGLGLWFNDWLMAGIGMIGAVIAIKHVIDITTSRDDNFAGAFGPGWQTKIPDDLHSRLRSHRWRPFYRRRSRGELHRDVVFGISTESGHPLRADLMQPPVDVPHTGVAMIFVHGGGWWYGRKNIYKYPYFQRMVSQGHVVMDIEYIRAPQSSVPGMVRDVKQAILWLKQQAGEFNINPNHIVLTGQSAGAQLCLLAAYTPNQPIFQPEGTDGGTSVSGIISYYGPPDMVALYHDIQARFVDFVPNRLVNGLHRLIEKFGGHGNSLANGLSSVVGGTPEEIPDVYREISPITYVNADCPPTLLLQGTQDLLVDYEQVERLHQSLKEAGAPVIYIPFPNCAHSFESILPRLSPPAQTAAYYTERFLALMV